MRLWAKILSRVTGKKRGQIRKKWVFDAKSSILNSVTVNDIDSDGKKEILFGTKNGILYVLSNNGKLKWKKSLKLKLDKTKAVFVDTETINSILMSPVVVKHKNKKVLVVGTAGGLIVGLSPTGELLWKYKVKGGIHGTPLHAQIKDKDAVVFGSTDHHLYALSTAGKLIWKYNAKGPVTSSPGMFHNQNKYIVFGTDHGWVKAVNMQGKLKWRFKTNDKVYAKPVITKLGENQEHSIIIGSNDNFLYALDHNGKLRWKYQTNGQIKSSATVADIDKDKEEEIFFGACDDKIYALATNSQTIWSYETDFWVVTSPKIMDIDGDGAMEVIAGSYDKKLYVLEGKGTYALNYMPGLSGVADQPGHFSAFITSQPGELKGKKIWELNIGGTITGLSIYEHNENKQVIVSTKEGKIVSVKYEP